MMTVQERLDNEIRRYNNMLKTEEYFRVRLERCKGKRERKQIFAKMEEYGDRLSKQEELIHNLELAQKGAW